MAPLGMLLVSTLTASPVCVHPAEMMLPREVKRVQLVSRPRFPHDECDGITGRECPFGDVNAMAALRMSAASAVRALGWADISPEGFCLPRGLSAKDVLLRFDEGDVDPLNEVVLLRSRRITVHANGQVLLTPANLVGRTDGGVWTHDVVTDPYQTHEPTLLTVIPDDQTLSAQIFSLDGWNPGLADITSDKDVQVAPRPRARLFTPEVFVSGDNKGRPVSVRVHGWCRNDPEQWDADPGAAPITRPLGSVLRGLSSDREYVVDAQQGNRRAVAALDSATPRAVLNLAPQVKVRFTLVDGQSAPLPIWQVKLVEHTGPGSNVYGSDAGVSEVENNADCHGWLGWEWPELHAPASSATLAVPPGPNRSICIMVSPNPKDEVWVAIPAPITSGAFSLQLRCSDCSPRSERPVKR